MITSFIAFMMGIFMLYLLGVLLVVPVKIVFKLMKNALVGGVTLLLFNLFGGIIGLNLAITPVASIVVGFLGVPGVILLLLFQSL